MDFVLEQAVGMCFEGDILQSLVLNVLRIHKRYKPKPPRVTPLEVLSIQSIMAAKLKDNVEGLILYSLVFGEWLDIFAIPQPGGVFLADEVLQKMHKEPRKVLSKMCKNREMLLAVMEHNMDHKKFETLEICVYRYTLLIQVHDTVIVGQIRHRRGVEFDIHLAKRLAKAAFSKGVELIFLEMYDENDRFTWEQMRDHMKPIIDNLNAFVPPEGWKEAIENGRRAVYERFEDGAERLYRVVFQNNEEFSASDSYWACVDRM